jgi:ATP-dependent helicase HepA
VAEFIPGQRWISHAEVQLGLGTVVSSDLRTVSIAFISSGETRRYARQSAPLTRVAFSAGDCIRSHEGWSLTVESVSEHNGLLTYSGRRDNGRPAVLEEGQLDSLIQLNRPAERLLTGQIDPDKWFELRYQTLLHVNRLSHSRLRGLTGGRTSLLPHQLYIAHEVANRYAPRVLLADEVGLGKTIEAGLILHQQLLTERARRVLIVVPESLLHQWLVEMLRRFNLYFSIFDQDRCQALEASSGQDNPFHNEQLVLCTLEFLMADPGRLRQAVAGEWDLLVVDEAHHLQWSPQGASAEYRLIEQLAADIPGVLLLTATPEQLGKASHFARLRLLDPARFPDLEAFIQEESAYEPIARAVEALLSDQPLDSRQRRTLLATLDEADNRALLNAVLNGNGDGQDRDAARSELVEHLLDRHGTGRVLFRNTRSAVQGFPERQLSSYPLGLPAEYANCLAEFQASGTADPHLLLCPELLYCATQPHDQPHWTRIDPRIEWLDTRLRELRPAKVLVITASAETAMDLAESLRRTAGLSAAVFHEGLSIVERDRAAAYFADLEYGARVLVCSEIGSEGRNFQFAHHLILFDLPLNPDLLEQRIGRLDRIGQTSTIHIHVPYLENSAQAIMYHWYQRGLGAFQHTCPAGHSVFTRMDAALLEALHQIDSGIEDLEGLIDTTRQLHREMTLALQRGRDRLLEYNSCRPGLAEALRDQALAQDREGGLLEYLERVFDCFGIDTEVHAEDSTIIRPGDHMQSGSFPGLRPEGMTMTLSRDTALANEDMQFITWEHPLVSGAIDLALGNELGNTAMAVIRCPGIKPGTLLIECLYTLESGAGERLQAGRYLPPTTVRVIIDQNGMDHDADLSHEAINQTRESVPAETAARIIHRYAGELRTMLDAGEQRARLQMPAIVATAHERIQQELLGEINRLEALRRFNPNVRDEEIRFLEDQWKTLTVALETAQLHLDALRVLVAT